MIPRVARRTPLTRGLAGCAVAAVIAGVVVVGGPAASAQSLPSISLAPTSGGPGSIVRITGVNFCSRTGCGPVRVTISGTEFGRDATPDAGGRWQSKAQVPGGMIAGNHEVVAVQMLDDGNELRASADFTYASSRGEAAEREAENRDAIAHLSNPSAPAVPPRGQPLSSLAAELEGPATAGSDGGTPAGTPTVDTRGVGETDDANGLPRWVPLTILGLVVAVGVGMLARRRTRGGLS